MNVWTYWSGPKPRWIDTCLRSMERCCKRSEFTLLTPENVREVSMVLPRALEVAPGVGTDAIRAAVLNMRGGLWVDADTVLVRDPIHLIDGRHDPKQFLYSVWGNQPERAVAGYVYSPAGHKIARQWHAATVNALACCDTVEWGSLGEQTLTPLVRNSGAKESSWRMDPTTFMPVDVDRDVGRYFKISGWRDFATEDTIGFGLNYSWMQANRAAMMNVLPARGNLMIHRLLHDAERGEGL